MGILSRLFGPRESPPAPAGPPAPPRAVPAVRARYDAAELTRENARHWAWADGFSARAADSIQVRYRLRTRARYEVANNSYARGIVETLANDTVGTGPRLQVRTGDLDADRRVEEAFAAWSAEVGLAEKLRTMRKARAQDGEAFARLVTNPALSGPVQLDLRLYEADQVATPYAYPFDPNATDGIRYDEAGNPTEYHVLLYHPGDLVHLAPYGAFERIDAPLMAHWFRVDRPGQLRGVPEITPALPLFAQLRRYTLAVIAAAETAADFAAVLYSDAPPDGTDAPDCEPFEHLEIERRMMTTLPAGWKMGQFRAEQPAASYEMFKREILNEIARCLNVPFNVAAGNSSSYNYSSGRLDHQVYHKSIGVDRSHLERNVLARVFSAWLAEARLAAPGLLPPAGAPLPYHWQWDGFGHVDPMKEAQAQQVRLASATTNLAIECAREGRDWVSVLEQRARELAMARALGIPTVEQPGAVIVPPEPDAAPADPNAPED